MTSPSRTDRVVVDFDHHSAEFAQNNWEIFEDLRERCPVAWSERYGGFWVVTKYEDVSMISRDEERFSSAHDTAGDGSTGGGILIPPSPNHPIPIEIDPPEFLGYRRLLNPWFSPAAMAKCEPRIRQLTHETIDRVIETGEFDIVMDLANPVPAVFTLEFLGVESEQWREWAEAIHAVMYSPPESDAHARARAGLNLIGLAIFESFKDRKDRPRDDLLTALAHAEVNGKPLSDEDAISIALLIVGGGIDTTTGLFANAAHYLHRNHDARELLRAEPDRIPLACEEFLRYSSPTQALARTVKVDTEVRGQQMRAGDRILLCWASANHDPDEYDDPKSAILDRLPNRHAAFGLGIHRCLGSNLARLEFRVMMEEMLRRMPDYVVDEAGSSQYETIGTVNGWVHMPASFTPGPKLQDGEP